MTTTITASEIRIGDLITVSGIRGRVEKMGVDPVSGTVRVILTGGDYLSLPADTDVALHHRA